MRQSVTRAASNSHWKDNEIVKVLTTRAKDWMASEGGRSMTE